MLQEAIIQAFFSLKLSIRLDGSSYNVLIKMSNLHLFRIVQ